MAGVYANSGADSLRTDAGTYPSGTSKAFTIAGWFKPQNVGGVFGLDNGSSFFVLRSVSDGRLACYYGSGPTTGYVESSQASPDGTWVYVALSFNGTNQIFFKGGLSSAVTQVDSRAANDPPNDVNTRLGAAGTTSYTMVSSRFAYVRVWTSALSQSELQAEQFKKSAVKTDTLWADYDLSTVSADAYLADNKVGGTAYNLTRQASATWLDDALADSATEPDMSEPSGASGVKGRNLLLGVG